MLYQNKRVYSLFASDPSQVLILKLIQSKNDLTNVLNRSNQFLTKIHNLMATASPIERQDLINLMQNIKRKLQEENISRRIRLTTEKIEQLQTLRSYLIKPNSIAY